MAQQQFQSNVKRNCLSEFKLRLLAEPQPGGTKRPTLSMGVYKNNPRIAVYTNVQNDRDHGRITAAMDTFVFFALLSLIRQVADGPSDRKETIGNNSTFAFGRKQDTPVTVSKTTVGKDKDGVVFIAVTAKDRPVIKFPFLPDEWHFFVHGDGTPFLPNELSPLYAKGWCESATQLIPFILNGEYTEPDFSKSNNSGGNQNNNQGNQNNERPQSNSTFSGADDLPFS